MSMKNSSDTFVQKMHNMIARWRVCLCPPHVSKGLKIYSEFCVEALLEKWKEKRN